jgi:hypothetical protein
LPNQIENAMIYKAITNDFTFKVLNSRTCMCIKSAIPGDRGYYQVGEKFEMIDLTNFIKLDFTWYYEQVCTVIPEGKQL